MCALLLRSGARPIAPLANTESRKRRCARSRCSARLSVEMPGRNLESPVLAAAPVMVNDCTGKVGQAVAEAAVAAGLRLVPLSLTGPGRGGKRVVIGNVEVDVREVSEREDVVKEVITEYPNVIVVDYTLPAAVNDNAEFYCKHGLPFVMGTTGGDREKLLDVARKSGIYSIIAPQMGKQVVAFVAAMEIMAKQFPGAFSGYTLQVTESHQSTKADVSGTALAVISSLRKLGLDFKDEQVGRIIRTSLYCTLHSLMIFQVELVRDPKEQMTRMGVPEQYLNGHAFHTYKIMSPDGTVFFEFKHNVCGRSIYAQGTVDAVLFLSKKIQEKSEKRLYNMIDVLEGGRMR
ncbi:probable 4-hydroxy-tetrahydrodipicolinate reductase 1, chloroplastic isoform X1 [Selaginella moellendorffii]|uniref:probable 4-hydroxy-tetrahydrodipicolinate reductase 1, chloroplastic isoform X1 n=1 Tax=Selaginella moellendorffii TaxID=88036 RepID=UPI000D1C75CC|nr:probable 4-hydroxy-tetrahydrodipicolinate reductase 1, chloroplastic isoform X1 [Selaginella moellendorffii]|eukprot:XP_024538820.1 probable 4-hydroxy-tetrahydrodipicolinate reductase 1, chloroplastic isoform X1 [Selaginella moellendorffii]